MDAVERQTGLLLLIGVAAELADDLNATVTRFLDAIGWISGDGTRLTGSMAFRADGHLDGPAAARRLRH